MARDADAQVLVVEDRDYLRHILVAVLEDFGYPAAGFASAAAALERLPALRPGVIVLDLHMPGMDGREFLGRLRANPAWSDLPVVVVSGVGEAERPLDDRRGLAVLHKPFDNETLIACIRQMIGPAAAGPAGAPAAGGRPGASRILSLLLPVVLAVACPARAQQGSAGGHVPAPAVGAPSVPTEAVPEAPRGKAIPLGMTPEGLAAKQRAQQGGAVGTDKATVTPEPPDPSVPEKGGR